ncbi:MAG: 16S rRNA (guanine(527)-N(7))-methyltransferase RsmG [Candidatus Dormibacteria bacterium]
MSRGGPALSQPRRQLLERYLELLYAENQRLNLTRIDRAEAWRRHIEESLDLVGARRWQAGERVLDLGSGGGVPGIPLAVALPGIRLGLIERDLAKAAYLGRCLDQLGLAEVWVVPQDARELARRPDFEPAQVLVSRAALSPGALLRVAAPLLGPGGEGLVHVGASAALDARLAARAQRSGLTGLRLVQAGGSRLLRFSRFAPG